MSDGSQDAPTSPSALSRLKELIGDTSTDEPVATTPTKSKRASPPSPRPDGGKKKTPTPTDSASSGLGAIDNLAANAAFVASNEDSETSEEALFAPGGALNFSAFPLQPIPLIAPESEMSTGGGSKEVLAVNSEAVKLLQSIKVGR